MKTQDEILKKLNQVSFDLMEAHKQKKSNHLIDDRQKEANIFYYETQLKSLLFCLDLENLDLYIDALHLNLL
jgi:hypothetical protein